MENDWLSLENILLIRLVQLLLNLLVYHRLVIVYCVFLVKVVLFLNDDCINMLQSSLDYTCIDYRRSLILHGVLGQHLLLILMVL